MPGIPLPERRAYFEALAAMLAAIHRVDIGGSGLDGFGKTGGFATRQIGRWTRQWELSKPEPNKDIDRLIENWTLTMKRDDVARLMLDAGVPCAPVRELAEVVEDENMHARGSLEWMDHPELGRIVLMKSPLVFNGVPRHPIDPIGPLGSANDAVFGNWLGQSAEALEALKGQGVIS